MSLADVVLWLQAARPHTDLDALDWGANPLRRGVDEIEQIDLLSFGADAILADEVTRSKFVSALTALRASAATTVRADVALCFAGDVAAQSFLLPAVLMQFLWRELDEVEMSVYASEP
ncbi:hypothetical protein [Methylosinus sp. 3S-1]|uniref:hypothetical protein n=1 Tax=Methylosinus sp. 3S-1 TaxID=1849840 RepID=UPI0012E9C9D7|nr:hypothetical protein [Methylosinus sp. 3S-1]